MTSDKTNQPAEPTAWQAQYASVAPLAHLLRIELANQLASIVQRAGIALGFPIEHRVKSWESIAEKVERGHRPTDDIRDLQDLVGLRVILQFRRDVDVVCTMIEQTLAVERRYDTGERLSADQFGYSSIHFVVKLPETWLSVPTMAALGDLRAEIQVRTLAQHIWAAASHTLQYKRETTVPPAVLRSVYRVSALLEMVDLEFERVLEQRQDYRESLVEAAPASADETLNVDLLERTLDELLPTENKAKTEEDYAGLLAQLRSNGISTRNQLVEAWSEHKDAVLKEDQSYVARNRAKLEKGEPISGTTEQRIHSGVYFTHGGLTRMLLLQLPGRVKMRKRKQSNSRRRPNKR